MVLLAIQTNFKYKVFCVFNVCVGQKPIIPMKKVMMCFVDFNGSLRKIKPTWRYFCCCSLVLYKQNDCGKMNNVCIKISQATRSTKQFKITRMSRFLCCALLFSAPLFFSPAFGFYQDHFNYDFFTAARILFFCFFVCFQILATLFTHL